jgi:hypothetical protein
MWILERLQWVRRIDFIAEIHCKCHGFPTESLLDEGVINPQAIQLIAYSDPKTVEAKHSAKQVGILDASGGSSNTAKMDLNFLSVEKDNCVCPVILVFPDRFLWRESKTLCPTTYPSGGPYCAPCGGFVVPPEGNDLTIFTILLPVPLNVNTEEVGGVT